MEKTSRFGSQPEAWNYIWEVVQGCNNVLVKRIKNLEQLCTDSCFRLAYEAESDSIFKIGKHTNFSSISSFAGEDIIFVFPKDSYIGKAYYIFDVVCSEDSQQRATALHKELTKLAATSDIYCYKLNQEAQSVLAVFAEQAKQWTIKETTALLHEDIANVNEALRAELRTRLNDVEHDIILCERLIDLGSSIPTERSCEFLAYADGFYCQLGNTDKLNLLIAVLQHAKCNSKIPVNFNLECSAHDFICHLQLHQQLSTLTNHLESLKAYKDSLSN